MLCKSTYSYDFNEDLHVISSLLLGGKFKITNVCVCGGGGGGGGSNVRKV